MEWLPTIVESGEIIGTISKKCAEESGLPEGLKVYANGTDKGSETIGTGCLRKDKASISYGTASTIEVSNKKYIVNLFMCIWLTISFFSYIMNPVSI